jgi:hypothetical protein
MQIEHGSFFPIFEPLAITIILAISELISPLATVPAAIFFANFLQASFVFAPSFSPPLLPETYCETAAVVVPSAAAILVWGMPLFPIHVASSLLIEGSIFQCTSAQGSISIHPSDN